MVPMIAITLISANRASARLVFIDFSNNVNCGGKAAKSKMKIIDANAQCAILFLLLKMASVGHMFNQISTRFAVFSGFIFFVEKLFRITVAKALSVQIVLNLWWSLFYMLHFVEYLKFGSTYDSRKQELIICWKLMTVLQFRLFLHSYFDSSWLLG